MIAPSGDTAQATSERQLKYPNLSTLDQARALLKQGFSVIPVPLGKKVPVLKWKAYQKRRPTEDELVSWFGNGHDRQNIAIITGAISGIVVVDADSPEAEQYIERDLPQTPRRTKTAKGFHYFYRHPGKPVHNKARLKINGDILPLDVRGDGGYVIAPGSVHPSGCRYELDGDWKIPTAALPALDAAMFIEPAPTTPEKVSEPALLKSADVTARARAYLQRIPGAIEGQGGDAHTLSTACKIVRGFDLDEETAVSLLKEWNATCKPEWSEGELRDKVRNALKYGTEDIGHLRDAERPNDNRTPATTEAKTTHGTDLTDTGQHWRRTDTGNAELFAALHPEDIKYDHARGRWLIFREHYWQEDTDGEIVRLAQAAARRRFELSTAIQDLEERKREAAFAISSETRGKIDNMLALAQCERSLADAGKNWNADPMLLCAGNGVVILTSGTLRPGFPSDRITFHTAVPYDPAAKCERFQQFLVEIFDGNTELPYFVQRAIGYSLTGDTSEQALFVCYGTGANGKTTFVKAVREALGEYAYNMPFSTVELKDRSAIPNDLAALVDRRLVTASETNATARLNEARIKALTGGDPITARFLHREFFTYQPVGKFWLLVNHKPRVYDDSYAFWRRVRLIPFTRQFRGTDADPDLENKLRAELPGILTWAIRGVAEWKRAGLEPPACVTDATEQYRLESDPLADFIAERCLLMDSLSVPAGELYTAYAKWAEAGGMKDSERLSSKTFGTIIGQRFEREKGRKNNVYLGIGLSA